MLIGLQPLLCVCLGSRVPARLLWPHPGPDSALAPSPAPEKPRVRAQSQDGGTPPELREMTTNMNTLSHEHRTTL